MRLLLQLNWPEPEYTVKPVTLFLNFAGPIILYLSSLGYRIHLNGNANTQSLLHDGGE
jgi:hypothetical protein